MLFTFRGGIMRKFYVILLLIIIFLPNIKIAVLRGQIVINEIYYDPPGVDTGYEWVELYNNSSTDIDISGWDLKLASGDYYTFPAGTVIEAHTWIVVHNNSDGTNTNDEFFTGSSGFGNMSNTANSVVLFNSTAHNINTIVDFIQYGAGGQTWESLAVQKGIWTQGDFAQDCDEGFSLNLYPDGDDNNTSNDWICCSASLLGSNCQATPTPPTETPTFTPTATPTSTPTPPTPFTSTPTPFITNTPTPSPTSTPFFNSVVINEVFYDPPGNDTGYEWVELYNNSSTDIDISGWDLKLASGDYYTFPAGTVIEAHTWIVVHNNSDGTNTNDEFFTGSSGFGNMSNTANSVVLFNSTAHNINTIVDFIQYGAGGQTWESLAVQKGIWTQGDFAQDCDEGFSLNLYPDGDDNNTSNDWICCSASLLGSNCQATPTPPTGVPTFTPTFIYTYTPGPTFTPTPISNSIVINEVYYDPPGNDTGFEWVELYNRSNNSVDISGWQLKLATGDYYTFPEGTIIEAKSWVVVHNNSDGTNSDDEFYTGTEGFGNMSNSANSVVLFSGSEHTLENLVDFIEYGDGGQTWESLAVSKGIWTEGDFIELCTEGYSLNLNPDGNDNNRSNDWHCCSSTKLGTNCVSTPTETPTITPTGSITPVPPSEILINEVRINDEGSDDMTFIEIYGPPGTNLSGYKLIGIDGRTGNEYKTVEIEGEIPQSGYFVIAQNNAIPNYTQIADVDFQNGPDNIVLTDAAGNTIDSIGYGNFGEDEYFMGEGEPAPEKGDNDYSLSRCPDHIDTNNNSRDFAISEASPGEPNDPYCPTPPPPTITPLPNFPTFTPTVTPTITIIGKLLITEVLTYVEEGDPKAVELLNLSSNAIDLSTLYFKDCDGDLERIVPLTKKSSTILESGKFAVLVDSFYDGQFYVPEGTLLVTVEDGELGTNGLYRDECLMILNSDNEIISTYGVNGLPPYLSLPSSQLKILSKRQSMQRISYYEEDIPENWHISLCRIDSNGFIISLGSHNCYPEFISENDIVINEVMVDRERCSTEFIEIVNISDKFLNLEHVYLADSDEYDILEPVNWNINGILPGQIGLIVEDGNYEVFLDTICPYVVVFKTLDNSLGNGLSETEPVILYNADRLTRITTYLYPPNTVDCQSAERKDMSKPDTEDNWQPSKCDVNAYKWAHSAGRFNCYSAPPLFSKPHILAAGFWDTYLTKEQGGLLKIYAFTEPEVEEVQLYYQGVPTGISLQYVHPGFFKIEIPINSNLPEINYPLELQLRATDFMDKNSTLWPYLEIKLPQYCSDLSYYFSTGSFYQTNFEPSNLINQISQQFHSTQGYNKPFIAVAGYYNTEIDYMAGGTLTIIAYVISPNNIPIDKVELYYQGLPTGVYLNDSGIYGDWQAGDNIFTFTYYIPENSGLEPGIFLFELKATDIEGNSSDIWPYLSIH